MDLVLFGGGGKKAVKTFHLRESITLEKTTSKLNQNFIVKEQQSQI